MTLIKCPTPRDLLSCRLFLIPQLVSVPWTPVILLLARLSMWMLGSTLVPPKTLSERARFTLKTQAKLTLMCPLSGKLILVTCVTHLRILPQPIPLSSTSRTPINDYHMVPVPDDPVPAIYSSDGWLDSYSGLLPSIRNDRQPRCVSNCRVQASRPSHFWVGHGRNLHVPRWKLLLA